MTDVPHWMDILDKDLPVSEQYELAKLLAANCGYQLVAEDNERSLEIKELIKAIRGDPFYSINNSLIIEGLEALLK